MKLKNTTIIILGAAKFDGIYESTSFTTAKFLARENDVIYVDYPYTFKDCLKEKGTPGHDRRKRHFSEHDIQLIDTSVDRLKVMIPSPVLSLNFLPEGKLYRFLLKWNERRIASKISRLLKSRKVSDFIFINSFNFHYPTIGSRIGATLSVYQCVDPLIIDYDKRHGEVSEVILARTSDVVVCTSKQLYREKLLLNNNTFFVANAADLSHSAKTLDENLAVHPALDNIPHPIIGYFGHIERRMDFPLLTKLIELHTEKSFVFVGPVSEEFVPAGFKDPKNVFFTGRLDYQDMPAVIKGFDVAIIPFKEDDVSKTIFPLKLFEYLGAAKPVVATEFNLDLADFTADAVVYASDVKRFGDALDFFIAHDDDDAKKARLRIAAENTWEARIQQLGLLLYDFYQLKLIAKV